MKTKLTEEQTDFLNRFTKGSWKLNSETGLIDIKGEFYCPDEGLKDFKGIKFGVVTGDFDCSHNKLTSLVGAPQKVGEDFDCSHNKLTSLVGAPQKVGAGFRCHNNKITSLVGAPQEVGWEFNCDSNKLTSLVGAPQKVVEYFSCDNNQLTSLEGAPQEVGKDFHCEKNPISKEFLQMIWERMKNGSSYYIALASLKKVFQEKKEKEIQKINLKYDSILSQIKDDDLAKSASGLSKFGII